jgi:hypothetical protein
VARILAGPLPSARGDRQIAGPPPSTEQLIDLIREGSLFPEGTALEGTEGIDLVAGLLAGNVSPDFVTRMVSESGIPAEFSGMEGFKEALSDWMSPYERFRLLIEDAIVEDNKIVFLARQIATTKHGGVEVETESATVWSIEGGLITQAVFYLDWREGLEAAGLDPDRHQSG